MYYIVAGGCSKKNTKDGYNSAMTSKVGGLSESGCPPANFYIPDGVSMPKVGSFDTLIRLTDDLQKYDSQVEGVVRRLERQVLDLDEKADFMVNTQRQKLSLAKYLQQWQWDDSKFPRNRGVAENLQFLLTVVNKLDEEGRVKSAQFNELKTQKNNILKKSEGQSLMTRDLTEVLTPDKVKGGSGADADFIQSEYLSTVVVVLSKGSEQEFLKLYEKMGESVVPLSAKKFEGLDDKEGNSLWRVVVFKGAVEGFKRAARDNRFTVRDFEYTADGYEKQKAQAEQLNSEFTAQSNALKYFCELAWSDVLVAWMHIKAMRVLVEAVLRYGATPSFASFIIQPQANKTAQMRKALADIFDVEEQKASKLAEAAAEGDAEEFYPYVSLSFSPFAPKAA